MQGFGIVLTVLGLAIGGGLLLWLRRLVIDLPRSRPMILPGVPHAVNVMWELDEDGRLLHIRPVEERAPVGGDGEEGEDAVAGYLVEFVDEDGRSLPGVAPYCDEEGDFAVFAAAPMGLGQCYIPYGAVLLPRRGAVRMRVWTMGESDMVGFADFPQRDWPRGVPFRTARLLRPLVGLCLLVAAADGSLEVAELEAIVRALTVMFELGPEDQQELDRMLEQMPEGDAAALCAQLLRRARGTLLPLEILDVLAALAGLHGAAHPAQVVLLERIATELGVDDDAWQLAMGQWGWAMGDGAGSLRETAAAARSRALAVLGVGATATGQEIREAYEDQMQSLAPEVVDRLPEEFRRVAQDIARDVEWARRTLEQEKP